MSAVTGCISCRRDRVSRRSSWRRRSAARQSAGRSYPGHGVVDASMRLDRAGFGWSDAGPMPRTAGRVADELYTLLDRGGIDPPFVLVGHSFGGLVHAPSSRRGIATGPPASSSSTPRIRRTGCRRRRRSRSKSIAGFGCAGAAPRRRGSARRRWSADSRRSVFLASRAAWRKSSAAEVCRARTKASWRRCGSCRRRRGARCAGSGPRRNSSTALGNQIAHDPDECGGDARRIGAGFGDLPLVTISSTDPGDYRLRQQDALAALSTRGTHVIASKSGHWIPLDQPQVVIDAIATSSSWPGLTATQDPDHPHALPALLAADLICSGPANCSLCTARTNPHGRGRQHAARQKTQ